MDEFLPVHFSLVPMGESGNKPDSVFSMTGLYTGEVKKAIPLADPNNDSKTQIEYEVEVKIRNGTEAPTVVTTKCKVADLFGAVGDFTVHSYRAATKARNNKPHLDGAQVLVMFVNGNTQNGVIVGGLKNTSVRNPYTMTGRFLRWVFNGVSVNINDDGELTAQTEGATKNDGTPDANRDDNNHGPYVQFTKTGNLYVTDNNGQSITLNSKDKAIRILAAEQSQLDAKKVLLGSQSSKENLVLGQAMVKALNELINHLTKAPLGISSAGPVQLNPTIMAGLLKWKATWVTSTSAPAKVLSTKSFTER